jgi:hypothetical protein
MFLEEKLTSPSMNISSLAGRCACHFVQSASGKGFNLAPKAKIPSTEMGGIFAWGKAKDQLCLQSRFETNTVQRDLVTPKEFTN